MIELYVYYKVSPADAQAALGAFEAWPGVQLLKRAEEGGDLQTWMEIHRGEDAAASEQALAARLRPYIHGSRHVERFVRVL